MRSISPEEARLWGKVTATIRPLSRERNLHQAVEQAEQTGKQAAFVSRLRAGQPSDLARPAGVKLGTTLDAGWDRRLRAGAVDPDRAIDLHGLTLDQAWDAIDRGLEHAIARGERLVLLITGHHRAGEPPVQRGRIRAAVHGWLAASRHAGAIAAVRGASRRHGGGGSLYLVLRRR